MVYSDYGDAIDESERSTTTMACARYVHRRSHAHSLSFGNLTFLSVLVEVANKRYARYNFYTYNIKRYSCCAKIDHAC